MATIATSAPEVLIAHAAATTAASGSAPAASWCRTTAPLHVVEMFRTLEALYPAGSISGLGRAPGTDPVDVGSAPARRRRRGQPSACRGPRVRTTASFPSVASVLEDRADAGRRAVPARSGCSARRSPALRSAPSSACPTRSPVTSRCGTRSTRSRITARASQPSRRIARRTRCARSPRSAVPTDDEAAAPRRPGARRDRRNRTGNRGPIPSIEEALAPTRSRPTEQAIVDDFFTGAVIGSADHASPQSWPTLAASSGANELMLSTLLPSLDDRAPLARADRRRDVLIAAASVSREAIPL